MYLWFCSQELVKAMIMGMWLGADLHGRMDVDNDPCGDHKREKVRIR